MASLIVTFISVSIFYFSLNAPLAAVFQLTLGVGTAVTLLLVSEEITTRTVETRNKNKIFLIVPFVLLLLLVTILEVPLLDISYLETPSNVPSLSISEILWSLRGIDALAQGLVVLTAVLTIAILLKKIGGGD